MARVIDLAAKFCAALASVFLTAMMGLVVFDVVARGLFNYPIRGSVELVELLLACTFFIGLPAAFLRDEHLIVDMIDNWAPRWVPTLKRFAAVVGVVALIVMAWQAGIGAFDALDMGDVTSDLSLPRILYWIPVLFGIFGAALAALLLFFHRPSSNP